MKAQELSLQLQKKLLLKQKLYLKDIRCLLRGIAAAEEKECMNHGDEGSVFQPKKDDTFLHSALRNTSCTIEIIDEFLKYNIDINAQNRYGSTALHEACKHEHTDSNVEIVKYLLSCGADTKLQDALQNTPLHIFVVHESHHYGMVKKFIERGANISAENCRGQQSLHRALKMNFNNFINIHELLREGPDVRACDMELTTPLHLAMANDYVDCTVVMHLLRSGVDVNAQNEGSNAPLHYAVCTDSRNADIKVRHLLKAGANMNAQNKKGETPPHVAGRRASCLNMYRILCMEKFQEDPRSIIGMLEVAKNLQNNPTAQYLMIDKVFRDVIHVASSNRNGKRWIDEVRSFGNHYLQYHSSRQLCNKLCLKYGVISLRVRPPNYNEFSSADQFYWDFCLNEYQELEQFTMCVPEDHDNWRKCTPFKLSEMLDYNFHFECYYAHTKAILKTIMDGKFPIYEDVLFFALPKRSLIVVIAHSMSMSDQQMSGRTVFLNVDCIIQVLKYLSKAELLNLFKSLVLSHGVKRKPEDEFDTLYRFEASQKKKASANLRFS